MSLLDIDDLRVSYQLADGTLRAVDGVSLRVEAGQSVGIAGESGCGKTTMGLAVPRLLPPNATIAGGRIMLNGTDVTPLGEKEMNLRRWTEVAFVFQGAMNALNPVQRIDRQIREAIEIHEPEVSKAEAERRVGELLELVGISASRAASFPHEFSGGMRQRVMIAMSLACRPKLLIADEPTTALDVISQAQILSLLNTLRRDQGLGLIMISHDLAAIRRVCDELIVMYAGVIVESGPTRALLGTPETPSTARHPYTQALIHAHPDLHGPRVLAPGLSGHPPDLSKEIVGCRFADRCPSVMDGCRTTTPTRVELTSRHHVACHLVTKEAS
jgi:peptide/nickel transport system ATP-binding protein